MAIDSTRLLRFSQHFDKFYTAQFTGLLQQHGLSMREVHILLFLSNNPGYDTARDITMFRGISKSQVSQAVDLLAAEGLLFRTPDAADRRIVHLSVTNEALPLVRQAQGIQASCVMALMDGLSEEQCALLQTLLETVLDNGAKLAEECS